MRRPTHFKKTPLLALSYRNTSFFHSITPTFWILSPQNVPHFSIFGLLWSPNTKCYQLGQPKCRFLSTDRPLSWLVTKRPPFLVICHQMTPFFNLGHWIHACHFHIQIIQEWSLALFEDPGPLPPPSLFLTWLYPKTRDLHYENTKQQSRLCQVLLIFIMMFIFSLIVCAVMIWTSDLQV